MKKFVMFAAGVLFGTALTYLLTRSTSCRVSPLPRKGFKRLPVAPHPTGSAPCLWSGWRR